MQDGFEHALEALAPAHAAALRLAREGASASEIAKALGIPAESIELLLDVARAKLARRLRAQEREP